MCSVPERRQSGTSRLNLKKLLVCQHVFDWFPSSYAAKSEQKLKAFALGKTFCSVFRHMALEKCDDDQVCLCNSLAIRQLSKKAVTVVHFEILADVPNQT